MAFRRIGNTLPPIVMEADRRALEDNVPFLATSPSTSRIVEKRVTVQLVDIQILTQTMSKESPIESSDDRMIGGKKRESPFSFTGIRGEVLQ